MLLKLTPDAGGIQKALDTVEKQLTKYKLPRKEITKAMLVTEETLVSLIQHGKEGAAVQMSVRRILDDVTIHLSAPGVEYDFAGEVSFGASLDAEEISRETEATIRNIILKSRVDDLKYRYLRGVNQVRFSVVKSKRTLLYHTVIAMLLAVVMGIALKNLVPAPVNAWLNENILITGKTMFMNALKMVVVPVVFFSILSCISQFGNLSEMGKIGGKVLSLFFVTTLIATAVGIGVFHVFQPGNADLSGMLQVDASAITSAQMNVSLKDILIGAVPSNIIKPFQDANMLQLIFIAALCGIAVGLIGSYSRILTDFFEACNELFLKITTLLIKFMPLAAFCSILSMLLQTGTQVIVSVLGICGVMLVSVVLMVVIYCVLMAVFSRLRPGIFLRKYLPTLLQAFSMNSSSAALPLNMEVCGKRLGVSSKVYSLALPLGATLNMDGTCLYLGVFSLALAKIYGIEITAAMLLSVGISIVVLSMGAPGVPGAGMICLSVLLTQMGVPVEAVGLVMGVDPLIGMFRTTINCLGDVVASMMVAKSEGLMDMEVYKSE